MILGCEDSIVRLDAPAEGPSTPLLANYRTRTIAITVSSMAKTISIINAATMENEGIHSTGALDIVDPVQHKL